MSADDLDEDYSWLPDLYSEMEEEEDWISSWDIEYYDMAEDY